MAGTSLLFYLRRVFCLRTCSRQHPGRLGKVQIGDGAVETGGGKKVDEGGKKETETVSKQQQAKADVELSPITRKEEKGTRPGTARLVKNAQPVENAAPKPSVIDTTAALPTTMKRRSRTSICDASSPAEYAPYRRPSYQPVSPMMPAPLSPRSVL